MHDIAVEQTYAAKNQHDCPRWTRDYQRLTEHDHRIECIGAFGHCNRHENDPPLVDHIHLNCLEVHVMLKGTQVFYVDGKQYKLAGDQIFLTLPNVVHSSGDSPQLRAEFYYFQLNPIDYKKMLGLDTRHTRALVSRLCAIQGHVFRGNSAMNALIASAFYNLATRDENLRLCAQAQIVSFLHLLYDIACKSDTPTVTPFVTEVCNHISRQLAGEISLEELARDFGYSLSYFKTKFRTEAGITPMHYINREKVEMAKELLSQGNSVMDAAMRLGFNSSNYFATVFRRFTSMSPSDYQRKSAKKEPTVE